MKYLKINILMFLFFCLLFVGCDKNSLLSNPVRMSFIACNEADITLIQNDKYTILIDTGEESCFDTVSSYLAERVTFIDLLILTHPDKDHIGNAVRIMETWDVGQVYMSSYQKGSILENELFQYIENQHLKYEKITEKKSLQFDELEVQVEPAEKIYDSSNNSSLITYITVGNIRTFFGADIKKKRIEELLNGQILESNIVKLPYHGRYISNMEKLLKKLNPDFVVVTCSELELETQKLLNRLEIEYEETKETIEIEIDGISWKRGE
ncbi:MAG: MBL fold metallo-hydrolase [Bacilli bacterium]|nr:MBL fold metallo-hydrolase [Bacilli bacterium]